VAAPVDQASACVPIAIVPEVRLRTARLSQRNHGQTSCPECGARFNARQAIDRWNAFCESKGKAPLKPSDTTSA
jgi:ribosomal protein L37AE/L43A